VNAAFFDSNIVVYAADSREASRAKRDASRELMLSRDCHISTQVMTETFNTLTRLKLVDLDLARSYVRGLSRFDVTSIEGHDVTKALEYTERYQINHWDGLILRACEKARISILYTEDLSHGQTYGDVTACNPFKEDFLA